MICYDGSESNDMVRVRYEIPMTSFSEMAGMVWGFDAVVYIVKDMIELTLYMYGCNSPNYVLSFIFNMSLKY